MKNKAAVALRRESHGVDYVALVVDEIGRLCLNNSSFGRLRVEKMRTLTVCFSRFFIRKDDLHRLACSMTVATTTTTTTWPETSVTVVVVVVKIGHEFGA